MGSSEHEDTLTVERARHEQVYLRNAFIAATCILLAGLGIAFLSVGYGLILNDEPAPGLVPFVIAVAFVVLSLTWLVTLRRGGDKPPAPNELEEEETEPLSMSSLRRTLLSAGITAVTLVIMPIIGFIPSMTLYVAALLAVVMRRRVLWSVIGAFLGTVVVYYGLYALGVSLPSMPLDLPFPV